MAHVRDGDARQGFDNTPVDTSGATDQQETPVRDFDNLPVLITIPVAARLLGISRASAYRWAETGVLPVKRLGGRIYIMRDRLREMMEAA